MRLIKTARLLFIGLLFAGGSQHELLAAMTNSRVSGVTASIDEGIQAYEQGAFEHAAATWSEQASVYGRTGKVDKQNEALVLSAQAYQMLGHYGKALDALTTAIALSEKTGNQHRLTQAWAVAGNLYLAAGDLENAERYLNKALELTTAMKDDSLRAVILNSLGNVLVAQRKPEEAVSTYKASLNLAQSIRDEQQVVRARSNLATALSQSERFQEARSEADRALYEAGALGDSYEKGSGLIALGRTYQTVRAALANADDQLVLNALSAFNQAVEVAYKIDNLRAASYAWGYMGNLYESERRYEEALELTDRAILAGQQAMAPEALYRWHWQKGRVLKEQGRLQEATAAYHHAMDALESIRPELAPSSGAKPFREGAGAIYFELTELLLRRAATQTGAEQKAALIEARDVIEKFKGAEIRDYFRDECVDVARSRAADIERASKNTVVLYPIVLPDRLELLISMQGDLKRIAVPVSAETLTKEVRVFRKRLEKRTNHQYLPHGQQLYDWLIRPILPLLKSGAIDTLVVVPDGSLRTIPFSALHDGSQFLIQQYAVATAPGLTLTDARPFRASTGRSLSVGLSEEVQNFPPLPNVTEELQTVQRLYPGRVLLNSDFVLSRLEQELKQQNFSIVHIASHGQFDKDVRKSFVLAFDQKLTMDKLDQFVGLLRFRDNPLALLTLSACETAAGDDRAALGLAGVAIKAGAASAVATLWFINDDASTTLVSEFYRQLKESSVSKAVALQRAQLKMLDDPTYQHPAYWSPFLLLSNWL